MNGDNGGMNGDNGGMNGDTQPAVTAPAIPSSANQNGVRHEYLCEA